MGIYSADIDVGMILVSKRSLIKDWLIQIDWFPGQIIVSLWDSNVQWTIVLFENSVASLDVLLGTLQLPWQQQPHVMNLAQFFNDSSGFPSLISVNDSSDILFLISVLSLDNKSFTSSQLSRLKVSLSAFPLSSFPSELCLARSSIIRSG